MVKACCDKVGLKKGTWSEEEDRILVSYVNKFGHDNWRALPKQAGLLRCGKSCRFRWLNYLRPDIKRGDYSKEEEEVIIRLHKQLGNRWSAIAKNLPGRTDNEIKNHWHTHLRKRNKEYRVMIEIKQTSVQKFASSANVKRESQTVPLQIIMENIGYDLVYPQCFSSNLVSGNGASTVNIKESNGVLVADQFMELESYNEVGKNISSQTLLADLFTSEVHSPSTLEDTVTQFPLSPLSSDGHSYMDVHYYTEMDDLFDHIL